MSALAGPTSVGVKRPGRAVLLAALTTSLVVSAGPAFSGVGEPRTTEGAPAARSGTSAGTLVYIKDFNVWIARGDGSGARALTRDGTLPFPYGSPTQSDAGVVVASYNKSIVRMDQQGRVLNTMDPAPLHTSAGENIDGTPIDLAISPDGTKVAYTFSQVQCSTGDSCSATGYTEATRFSPVGNPTYFWDPSWVTNTRTLQTGGWNSQVQLHDLGSAPKYWFDDRLMHPFPDSTDLGDTELSPDGRHLVAIRGYGEDTAMAWYDVRGSAQQGPAPGLPVLFCRIYEPGIAGPTWAPDGDSLAWTEDDGIWTKSGVDDCSATQGLLIPGGSEPDWSPAGLSAVDPVPAPTPLPNPAPTATPTSTPTPTPATERVRNQKRPVITGLAKVGKKLTVNVGAWTPKPSAYAFRWFRNGKAIKGAGSRTYKVVRADRGKRLTVRVTARRAGYVATTAASSPRKVR